MVWIGHSWINKGIIPFKRQHNDTVGSEIQFYVFSFSHLQETKDAMEVDLRKLRAVIDENKKEIGHLKVCDKESIKWNLASL